MTCGFVFPGQGSQEVGMLRDFFARESIVVACFDEAESAIGLPLRALALEGPETELNRTEVTQPVLLTASVSLWRCWRARGGPAASVVSGHSLGEYSALVAAGAIEFADAVRLVQLRGRLMQAAVPAGTGAMAAILGLDEDAIAECCRQAGGIVTPANLNAPGQIVIAGASDAVERAISACSAAGAKRAIKLAVSVPSHCALMEPVGAEFGDALSRVRMTKPSIPVVQNVDAGATDDPERIRANLVAQLSKPVRWTQCVQSMVARGATSLVECGPGKVLTGLIKRIDKSVATFAIGDVGGFDAALSGIGHGG